MVEKHPVSVVMLSKTPSLLEEGAATAFALRRLAQKYGIRSKKFLQGIKVLGSGGLSYLLMYLGIGVAANVFYRLMRRGHKYEKIYRKEMGLR